MAVESLREDVSKCVYLDYYNLLNPLQSYKLDTHDERFLKHSDRD